jgi:hypothetical protein
MHISIKATLCLVAIAAAAGCATSTTTTTSPGQPAVGSSSDLSAFEGARAGQAEMGIQNLGYEGVRTMGLTAFWLNRVTGACAGFTRWVGRYSNFYMLPAEDC